MNLVYNRTFPETIMQVIENEYTNWSSPYDYRNIRRQFAKIFGDTGFAVTSIEFSRLHATSPPTSKTYVYKFMPKPSKRSGGSPEWMDEANHDDDIRFEFGFIDQPNAEDWEIELSKHVMRYWTNFAKTGDPNSPNHPGPVWREYDLINQHYMELDRDLGDTGGKQFAFAKELNFWLEVFPDLVHATDNQGMKTCGTMISLGNILFSSTTPFFMLFLKALFI
ncbi:acetylcholinesterase-like [Ruditapes philippinarum]|uniref:acetylcholinesterase-like n=1 Tax=Ruditapes philippinarum TaxID=129788 RepID=UPI00295A7A4E|nr:acetylcholinesterase-like [Ruditapes philippinarum]